MNELTVHLGDNLGVLVTMTDACVSLVYIDPPFNTNKTRKRTQIATERDKNGDRIGFQGNHYRTIKLGTKSYHDVFDDYLAFIEPRLIEARRILTDTGSLFFHIDYREAHYCKILLDQVFGRDCFMNEIIWAYDYGARSKKCWSTKHDTIFWYVKNPKNYVFNYEEIDRIPYMVPGLVGAAKAARGKTPTDVWWQTIVPTNGKEKTGYPTQKPRGVIDRIVRVHSKPGDTVCDFFAGSGTLGESAVNRERNCILIDNNPEALSVMEQRFSKLPNVSIKWHGWTPQDTT